MSDAERMTRQAAVAHVVLLADRVEQEFGCGGQVTVHGCDAETYEALRALGVTDDEIRRAAS